GAGRDLLSQWLADRARQRLMQGDTPGALVDLDRAIDWNPRAWSLYLLRAEIRQKMNRLNESLADYNETIDLLDHKVGGPPARQRGFRRSDILAHAHAGRSWVHVRLGRSREALDDATRAVQISPSPESWNTRAYARAILNTELEEGLADINMALARGAD